MEESTLDQLRSLGVIIDTVYNHGSLVDCRYSSINGNQLDLIAELDDVVWLALEETRLAKDDLQRLAPLVHLEYLSLNDCVVCGACFRFLEEFTSLKVLRVRGISEVNSLVPIIVSLPSLVAVEVSNSKFDVKMFEQFLQSNSLSDIDAHETRLTRAEVEAFDIEDVSLGRQIGVRVGDGSYVSIVTTDKE